MVLVILAIIYMIRDSLRAWHDAILSHVLLGHELSMVLRVHKLVLRELVVRVGVHHWSLLGRQHLMLVVHVISVHHIIAIL